MSAQRNGISEITDGKQRWTIVAKVLRLWKTNAMDRSNLPFSLEMVLMDNKGDKIHASAKKTIVYKFDRVLKEGDVYCFHYFSVVDNAGGFKYTRHKFKLNFYLETKVNPINGIAITISPFTFVPLSDILSDGFDQTYLVDVIGMMTAVGTEKDLVVQGNRTKFNVIEIDNDGYKIDCALFGTYVDDLNTFLASGDTVGTVVVMQLAKVKIFQGKVTLQNALHCTKLFFNPQFPEAAEYKKRALENNECYSQGISQMSESIKLSLEDEFLNVLDPKNIEELRLSKERLTCVVLASISHIVDPEDWWYYACKCNKSVFPDEKSFFCDNCNKHVINVTPRYRIRIGVLDYSGTANFVIFDRDASDLFKKSCHDMIDSHENSNEGDICPRDISNMVDQTFLFKVESTGNINSKFEPSFRVKKMTSDPIIIQKFEETFGNKSPLSITPCSSKKLGLLSQSDYEDGQTIPICNVDIEPEKEDLAGINSDENFGGELSPNDPVDLTPAKRPSQDSVDGSFAGSSNAKILKTIKKEDDA